MKRIIALLLVLYILPLDCLAYNIRLGTESVYVDENLISIQFYVVDEQYYFKVRDVAYILRNSANCFIVDYDENLRSIILNKGHKYTPTGSELLIIDHESPHAVQSTSKFIIGNQYVTWTGYNINGSNYFSLTDYSNFAGFRYEIRNNSIYITTDKIIVPVTGIEIDKSTLSLYVGDQDTLTYNIIPSDATLKSCSWRSSNNNIVSVSDSGCVTALQKGIATISAISEDGGFIDDCTVSVFERLPDEYKINSITIMNSEGNIIDEIPDAKFWAELSITHQRNTGNTMILLASYDNGGKYLDMMLMRLSDVNIGSTFEASIMFDNTSKDIKCLKAFLVSSLTNMIPLSNTISYPAT